MGLNLINYVEITHSISLDFNIICTLFMVIVLASLGRSVTNEEKKENKICINALLAFFYQGKQSLIESNNVFFLLIRAGMYFVSDF